MCNDLARAGRSAVRVDGDSRKERRIGVDKIQIAVEDTDAVDTLSGIRPDLLHLRIVNRDGVRTRYRSKRQTLPSEESEMSTACSSASRDTMPLGVEAWGLSAILVTMGAG